MQWDTLFEPLLGVLISVLPQLTAFALFVLVVSGPLPGRGPRLFQRRDPWRRFKHEARRVVMSRAGGRCEGPVFVAWGRCGAAAIEADHVHPWARGGPTVLSNGQALCRRHNRKKGAVRPPWWYVLALESRRRSYFPQGEDVRVWAIMNVSDKQARATVLERQRRR